MQGRHLIVALVTVTAISLLLVAGFVGYIAGNHGESDQPPRAASESSTTTPTVMSEIPPLRDTVAAFMADGTKSETTGTPTLRDLMNTYAVPVCGSMLASLAEAFGGSTANKSPLEVISVDQHGTTGTAVTHDQDTLKDETSHWIFDGSSWRFTCEGVFDTTSSTSPAAPVAPTTVAAPQLPASDPVLLQPCFDYEIGLEVGGVRCSPGDIHGPTRWTAIP